MFRFLLADIAICLLALSGCSLQSGRTPDHVIKSEEAVKSPHKTRIASLQTMGFKPEYPANRESSQDKPQAGQSVSKGEMPGLKEAITKPLSPEKTEALLEEVGSNWFYGQGLGETALTVGTVVIFPPYALLVAGNAALQISGEERVGLSDVLPEEGAKVWEGAYDGVTSVPGQTTALISGEDFRTKDIARERILAVINK